MVFAVLEWLICCNNKPVIRLQQRRDRGSVPDGKGAQEEKKKLPHPHLPVLASHMLSNLTCQLSSRVRQPEQDGMSEAFIA